ncbi:hypothetical protein I6A60_39565 [Frankia sp. AgB1.9]|uniref:effector-associated domain EAD1-containing protein n=1 Tax=unclassified Frankia TaxID=2632575 RepID=UPI0019317326|nr:MULTISPECIES: effector-associated domain EAD1-containing protein [unclassified Frankia]MBL7491854.1 hypothetical protein [Frankia sp. AgW1.1]MBL7553884.1 hypothetical protein [Frankia sp. AgB1.9]MBL7618026.1 hypothetical protein [Frankia sp. AgB1.8]
MNLLSDDELAELARVYWQPLNVSQLLQRAGIGPQQQPVILTAYTSVSYWQAVNVYLSASRNAELRGRILGQARADYPANPVFIRGVADAAAGRA